MANAEDSLKPRLFRKTIRSSDSSTSSSIVRKAEEHSAVSSFALHTSLSKFAFSSKLKSKISNSPNKRKPLCPSSSLAVISGVLKPKFKQGNSVTRSHNVTQIRKGKTSFNNLSLTLTPSLLSSRALSQLASRDASPRASSSLNIEAINLELKLTAILTQSEDLPSPIRKRQFFQAHMLILSDLAKRDPSYGSALQEIIEELGKELQEARYREAEELEQQNRDLMSVITDHKEVIKKESEDRCAQERVLESMTKEKNLLLKKVEELQMHCRKAANISRQSTQKLAKEDLDGKDSKIQELEAQLVAARTRETRLLGLLETIKESAGRGNPDPTISTHVQDPIFTRPQVVPPLNMSRLSYFQVLPSQKPKSKAVPRSSDTSTELFQSPFTMDLSEDNSCN